MGNVPLVLYRTETPECLFLVQINVRIIYYRVKSDSFCENAEIKNTALPYVN